MESNSESLNLANSQSAEEVAPESAEEENYKLHRRFDRIGRLIGDDAMKKLFQSHVMVIGLGGVGSWAAESLVRSGVGEISLVDFDEICITNFNRQIHSLQGLVGKKKAEVLGERMTKINPQVKVHVHPKFYNYQSAEEIIDLRPEFRPDFIIDAIDSVTAKCHLLNFCRQNQIPVVCSSGSGGRMDPTQIQVRDLSETEVDPLARSIRKILRSKYDFPEKGPFGIPTVFSPEPVIMPKELAYDQGKGFKCVCPQGQNEFFNCDNRNLIMGNASFVTGAFGFTCASIVVRQLLNINT